MGEGQSKPYNKEQSGLYKPFVLLFFGSFVRQLSQVLISRNRTGMLKALL
jgi:hypothetical protein